MTVTAVAPAEVGVTVGTFFVRSWGYDQTNIDFYKVVGLTPKGVKVQHWSSALVDENKNITHVVPGDRPKQVRVWPKLDPDCEWCRRYTETAYWPGSVTYAAPDCPDHRSREIDSPVEQKRLQAYVSTRVPSASGTYIAVGPYSDHAGLWDGKPEYETAAGWGH